MIRPSGWEILPQPLQSYHHHQLRLARSCRSAHHHHGPTGKAGGHTGRRGDESSRLPHSPVQCWRPCIRHLPHQNGSRGSLWLGSGSCCWCSMCRAWLWSCEVLLKTSFLLFGYLDRPEFGNRPSPIKLQSSDSMKAKPLSLLVAFLFFVSLESSAQSISAGAYRTAIVEDGDLLLYGLSLVWSPDIPTWDYLSTSNLERLYNDGLLIDSEVASVAAGDDHLLYIKEDSSLWVFGNSRHGQAVTTSYTEIPIKVADRVKRVWAG